MLYHLKSLYNLYQTIHSLIIHKNNRDNALKSYFILEKIVYRHMSEKILRIKTNLRTFRAEDFKEREYLNKHASNPRKGILKYSAGGIF